MHFGCIPWFVLAECVEQISCNVVLQYSYYSSSFLNQQIEWSTRQAPNRAASPFFINSDRPKLSSNGAMKLLLGKDYRSTCIFQR